MLHYIVFHPHAIAFVIKSTPHPIPEYPLSTLFS
jgi:hypothetical protein